MVIIHSGILGQFYLLVALVHGTIYSPFISISSPAEYQYRTAGHTTTKRASLCPYITYRQCLLQTSVVVTAHYCSIHGLLSYYSETVIPSSAAILSCRIQGRISQISKLGDFGELWR